MKRVVAWFPTVAVLAGTYLVAFNVFSFDYNRGCGYHGSSAFDDDCANPVAYSYEWGTANGIGIGSILIVAGTMAYNRKKS